ncbi:MAG: heme exporter protein CcmB [Thermoguttaceae bacterium]|jgi:heme exporter protein B
MVQFWWIIHKDLTSEIRTGRVWPPLCLYSLLAASIFSFQMDLLPGQRGHIAASLLWLVTLFAGMLCMDRTFVAEREDGCWHALRLYPVSMTAIYFAKLAVNVITLSVMQLVLIALLVIIADLPLANHPWAMLSLTLLGNLGLAAVGTLFSALGLTMSRSNGILSLLVLPLVIPVVIAATQATELLWEDDLGTLFWRWIELLIVFDVVFIAAGAVLIDFVTEE